jgi:hypothetical protein
MSIEIPRHEEFLNTGDTNAPLKNFLIQTAENLCTQGHRVLRRLDDRIGLYAFLMRNRQGNTFYLIAKTSRLWQDRISCQSFLPRIACNEKRPILLAWSDPESKKLRFYLFDPSEIIENNFGLNSRKGVDMINFSIKLGKAIDTATWVWSKWQ